MQQREQKSPLDHTAATMTSAHITATIFKNVLVFMSSFEKYPFLEQLTLRYKAGGVSVFYVVNESINR
jgi:hypothetical protein